MAPLPHSLQSEQTSAEAQSLFEHESVSCMLCATENVETERGAANQDSAVKVEVHDNASVAVHPGESHENETQEGSSPESVTALYFAKMSDLERKLETFGLSTSSVLSDENGKVKNVYPRENNEVTKYEAKINVRVGRRSLNAYFGMFDDVQDATILVTLAWSFLHTPIGFSTGTLPYTTWDLLKNVHGPFFPRNACMRQLKNDVLDSLRAERNLAAQFVAFVQGVCTLTEAARVRIENNILPMERRRPNTLNSDHSRTKRARTSGQTHYQKNKESIRDAAFAIASISAAASPPQTQITPSPASKTTLPSHAPLPIQDCRVGSATISSDPVHAPVHASTEQDQVIYHW